MTLRMALRDLLHHRREARGVITMVALGTALFIVAMSFVATISTNADRLLFGTIGAPWLVEPATSADVLTVDEDAAASFAAETGADSVRLRVQAAAGLAPATDQTDATRPESAAVTLVGVDLDQEASLAENFGLQPADLPAGGDHVVLHDHVADQLGVTTGDDVEVALGGTTTVLTVQQVATPDLPNFTLESWVVGDRATVADLALGTPDGVNQILVDAPDDAATEIAAAAGHLEGAATVSPWTDTTWSALGLAPQLWAVILLAVLTFTFLVICIGLTSLVYSAILARLRDAAILQTTGMRPRQLRGMFLAETTMQYIAGFVLGAVAASAVILGVNLAGVTSTNEAFTFAVGSTVLSLEPAWWAYATPFAIGLLLTTVVLWFPIRAISRQPVLDLLELSA